MSHSSDYDSDLAYCMRVTKNGVRDLMDLPGSDFFKVIHITARLNDYLDSDNPKVVLDAATFVLNATAIRNQA